LQQADEANDVLVFNYHARQHIEKESRELLVGALLVHLNKDFIELVEVGLYDIELLRSIEALHLCSPNVGGIRAVRVGDLSPDACLNFGVGKTRHAADTAVFSKVRLVVSERRL